MGHYHNFGWCDTGTILKLESIGSIINFFCLSLIFTFCMVGVWFLMLYFPCLYYYCFIHYISYPEFCHLPFWRNHALLSLYLLFVLVHHWALMIASRKLISSAGYFTCSMLASWLHIRNERWRLGNRTIPFLHFLPHLL